MMWEDAEALGSRSICRCAISWFFTRLWINIKNM